jgi:hypothetical protein
VVGDAMDVAMPASSMFSIERCGVQPDSGGLSSPACLSAANHAGGTMWWCTSMR